MLFAFYSSIRYMFECGYCRMCYECLFLDWCYYILSWFSIKMFHGLIKLRTFYWDSFRLTFCLVNFVFCFSFFFLPTSIVLYLGRYTSFNGCVCKFKPPLRFSSVIFPFLFNCLFSFFFFGFFFSLPSPHAIFYYSIYRFIFFWLIQVSFWHSQKVGTLSMVRNNCSHTYIL